MEIQCPKCNFKGEALVEDVVIDGDVTFGKCPKCKLLFRQEQGKPAQSMLNNLQSTHRMTKACPFCGEEILLEAIKCKHCNSMLEEKSQSTVHRISSPKVNQSTSTLKVAGNKNMRTIAIVIPISRTAI